MATKRPGILHSLERASHRLARGLAGTYAETALTEIEANVLFHLLLAAEELPMGTLLAAFGLAGSTGTSAVDRLERRGLATRRVNSGDRRSFLVGLTPAGRAVAGAVRSRVRAIEAAVRAKLDERDLEGYFAVMDAIETACR